MARIRNVDGGGERTVPDAVARVVVGQGRAVYADLASVTETVGADVSGRAVHQVETPTVKDDAEPPNLQVEPGVSNVTDLIEAVDAGLLDVEEVLEAEQARPDGGRKTLLARLGHDDQE